MKTSFKFLFAAALFISLLFACRKPATSANNGTCSDGIQNQNETNVDCGGVCSVCQTCSDGIQNQGETAIDCGGPCGLCPISYPQSGTYGPNFLRNDTITAFSSGTPQTLNEKYYSMAAQLPAGTSLKVVMTFTPTSVDAFFPNGWALTVGSGRGWSPFSYDQATNSQQFVATGADKCDMQFMFMNHGAGTINFYENGAATPARIKVLSW